MSMYIPSNEIISESARRKIIPGKLVQGYIDDCIAEITDKVNSNLELAITNVLSKLDKSQVDKDIIEELVYGIAETPKFDKLVDPKLADKLVAKFIKKYSA